MDKNKIYNEQINMFFDEEETKNESQNLNGKISATQFKYVDTKDTTCEELFNGFDEIRVITFSFGLSFIERIIKNYKKGEVIIGFDKLINSKIADLLSLQEYSYNYVCSNKYLQKRINDNEFKFFVVNDIVSHQKVYLLKSYDGRVRTILGSANMSQRAWSGEQLEDYIFCDDIECYNHYINEYEELKERSTDEISKGGEIIKEDKSNFDELPIFKKIEKDSAIIINEAKNEDNIEYDFKITKLSQDWQEKLKSINIKSSKDGNILFDINKVKRIKDVIKKENNIRIEKEKITPQLILDYSNKTMSYNNNKFDYNVSDAQAKKDAENIIKYMFGFDSFTNNTIQMKTSYWKVLNYMFLSPFIAKLRYVGEKNNYEDRFFPMYLLIYGESDAGKTNFVKTVQKLMLNTVPNKCSEDYFSPKPITSLKLEVKGCPILIDEMTSTHWKYAKNIVKADDFLINQHEINHPTFIIISNDVKDVVPDISKRVIVVNVNNRINRTEAALNGRSIINIRKEITNSFYIKYVERMFDAVEELTEQMKNIDSELKKKWYPDIFKISSSIIIDIMNELNISIPDELKIFEWKDYMGDIAISRNATEIIKDEYIHNKSMFYYNKKRNELELDFSCYSDKEANKKLNILHNELPAILECKIVGKKAIMKNQNLEDYTGMNIKIKKRLFK